MKIKKILIYLFAVGAVVLLIKNASSAIRYASDAIDLCLEMIVPTLFPFFICSGILIYSGFCELLAKAFQFCMYPLFRISPVGSSAFILGIVSGYPLGAVTAGELYANNYISKTEAERLLAFCNNSGPLFILGSVGIAIYSNIKYGIALYVAHILAALTVSIVDEIANERLIDGSNTAVVIGLNLKYMYIYSPAIIPCMALPIIYGASDR